MPLRERKGRLLIILEYAVNAVIVIALAWFCVYGFGQRIYNVGQSMQSVIHAGETVLLNKVVYRLGEPKRFDVICFTTQEGRENIKRIIGLPGETIQIKDSKVFVNGGILPGKFSSADLPGKASEAIFLGSDEYFVLGDNRDSSEDSRFESIGNIKRESIMGTIWFRFSPIVRIGFVR